MAGRFPLCVFSNLLISPKTSGDMVRNEPSVCQCISNCFSANNKLSALNLLSAYRVSKKNKIRKLKLKTELLIENLKLVWQL
jgi:hypothetical protein